METGGPGECGHHRLNSGRLTHRAGPAYNLLAPVKSFEVASAGITAFDKFQDSCAGFTRNTYEEYRKSFADGAKSNSQESSCGRSTSHASGTELRGRPARDAGAQV